MGISQWTRSSQPPELELQQKDNLCGPFHAARVLRDAGVTAWEGQELDQDLVALHAGTGLPRLECEPEVPPGAASRQDYRHELALVEPARAGTPTAGLVRAIEELSEGRLACVPLTGEWTAENVTGLMRAAPPLAARLIANVRTGRFWGSRPPAETLIAVLSGALVQEPPPADWDAGHFVELEALIGGAAGSLVLVRDSYPSLGWMGRHLQPPGVVADALMRGDGKRGGVLVVVGSELAPAVERLAGELSLQRTIWGNKS